MTCFFAPAKVRPTFSQRACGCLALPHTVNPPLRVGKKEHRGFTLVELLVVIAIITILGALAIPSINAVMGGAQLTSGSQMLSDQISLARQTALSSNHDVEVRFYQFADPNMPGEQANSPSTGKYRAMQAFEMLDSGTAVQLGKIQRIPSSIIIDSGAQLSTLLSSSQQKTWTTSDPQVSLPVFGTSYNCRVFRFHPDGSTNLSPPTSQWFLTLHSIGKGDALAQPPANFFTILVYASNGHVQSFRP